MKASSLAHAEAMKARNSPTTISELVKLLKDNNVEVTFSKDCVSGFIGDACQCWRCKESRGEEVTRASEKLAQVTADRLRFGGTREERSWRRINEALGKWNAAHNRTRVQAIERQVEAEGAA